MLRSGISSVSYRNRKAADIIEAARKTRFSGIEWSSDTHAPPGDLDTAENLMMATLRAGLTVSAYGSFHRIGGCAEEFAAVLASARMLQAPNVRVWAAPRTGVLPLASMAETARPLADEAGKFGITLCIEAHERSQVDRYETLAELVRLVAHPFFRVSWAPLPGLGKEELLAGAEALAPELTLIHVRNWNASYARQPLEDEDETWPGIIDAFLAREMKTDLDHWALIEYLEDESPQTLEREAETLAALVSRRVPTEAQPG